ncbi:hypothetical protein GCM10010185_34580 [Saccharothrix coeruleofusca]|uniref:Uncharacterized protein n=1 Tax=Saccharothrix coeruleofusca TaxID=33919 RepID=A0A918EF91_9PSEU|nr:hypothetical protein GCM10010185_34580 [Saccharothrix coeruleofusca]
MESRCTRCDLLIGQCEHTRAAPPRRARTYDLVLISPASVAHLPDCPHNTESDIPRYWGEISGDPRAWERVGNGIPVPANGGGNPALVAKRRCSDCEARS